MLGWNFNIYRSTPQKDRHRIAAWQTKVSGIHWIDELVKQEKAISLGGDGYPYKYSAMAKHVKAIVLQGPPYASSPWRFDYGDILSPGWEGRTTLDRQAWEECDPDEWLTIDVWDES